MLTLTGCRTSFKTPLLSKNVALPQKVWLLGGDNLSPEQQEAFQKSSHLLIMIPGISSGDLEESCRFLGQVRAQGGQDLAVFYNWGGLDFTRSIASTTSTANAASGLIGLCRQFLGEASGNRTVDILAHSAGTIIVNKAAVQIRESYSPVRFRQVLFLGTPHDPEVNLDALKSVSDSVLNIFSDYDKINRNVSSNSGVLADLEGGAYRNLRMDTSLGGRRIRHYAFLKNNPENWVQYGGYLQTGQWPRPAAPPIEPVDSVELLHGVAIWIKSGSAGDNNLNDLHQLIKQSLAHPNPEVEYYSVILTGLLKASTFTPQLKSILDKQETPTYLRAEIYQALGNFEDGKQIHFLQRARKQDKECSEEIRDVLREFKLKRIRPVRERRVE
ncbi:MAG: hypothetical protein JXA52_07735 [Planctomycetes bacterium]|nr:hypothetical protein [Planctomycetota bacterium]